MVFSRDDVINENICPIALLVAKIQQPIPYIIHGNVHGNQYIIIHCVAI